MNAFDIPGRQAFVVELVGREDLQNAIALNSSMFNGARVVGPAVAGVLVAAAERAGLSLPTPGATSPGLWDCCSCGSPRLPHPRARHRCWMSRRLSFCLPVPADLALLLLLGLVSLMGTPYWC